MRRALSTAALLLAALLLTAPASASYEVLVGGETHSFETRPVIEHSGTTLVSPELIRAIWEGGADSGKMGESSYRFGDGGDLLRGGKTVARSRTVEGEEYLQAAPLSVEGIDIFFDPKIGGWRIVGTLREIDFTDNGLKLVAAGPLAMRNIPGGSGEGDLTVQIPGVRPAPELFSPGEQEDGSSLAVDYRDSDHTTLLKFDDLPPDRNISFYRSEKGRLARIDLQEHLDLADYRAGAAGSALFTLNLGSNPEHEVFRLDNPHRLVFDFPGVVHKGGTRHEKLDLESVREVRVGQFKQDPPITRLVFETTRPLRYRIIQNSGGTFRVQLLDPARMRSEGLVVVDAGHGGSDPGAEGVGGHPEKTINLQISRKVEKLLLDAGYQVIQTRDTDRFVSLEERADLANELAPVAFVSIHSNYYDDSEVQGVINFHHETSAEGYKLASRIQQGMIESTGAVDKGVRTANFFVLRETRVPSVLVEAGFMSNPDEMQRLLDPEYQDKLAAGISRGVVSYIRSVDFNSAPMLENASG